jgi:hypothetical protein
MDRYEDSRSKVSVKEEAKNDEYDSKSFSRSDYQYQNLDQKSENNLRSYSRKKGKRRSKKDQVGRNFKWDHCEKTYLSYPALYTHKKLKHWDKPMVESVPIRKTVRRIELYNSDKNPTSLEYFTTPDKVGGPIDPLTHFYTVVKEELQMDPKYFRLYSFLKVFWILDGFAVEDPETLIPKRDYDELTAHDKEKCMSWDEVFALYLREVSRIVNPNVYKDVLKFVLLYREWVNEFGWQKKLLYEGHNKSIDDMKAEYHFHDYSIWNNAEHMPEVANELIMEYIENRDKSFGLNMDDCIDLVRNFTHWLFTSGFTSSKISMKPAFM